MVGAEVDVLVAVLPQRVERLDHLHALVHLAVVVLERLPLVAAAQAGEHVFVEQGPGIVGDEHRVHRRRSVELVGVGAHGLAVRIDGALVEVEHAAGAVAVNVEAVHDVGLDVGLHLLGIGGSHLLAGLGLR